MSLCLILQTKDIAFIGADTAISSFSNKGSFRAGTVGTKIFHFDDYIFFCSGKMDVVHDALEEIGRNIFFIPKALSIYLKNKKIKKSEKGFDIEIIGIEKKTKNIFQISQYNNFDLMIFPPTENDTRVFSAGFKTRQCSFIAEKGLAERKNVKQLYIDTFDSLSSAEIGGELSVYSVDKEFKKFYDGKIKEENLRFKESNDLFLFVGEAVVGNLIAGNQLYITSEDSSFTSDAQGTRLYNASLEVTNNLISISVSPEEKIVNNIPVQPGISIQSKASGNWENVFYSDIQGNLIMKGGFTGLKGTLGGWTIDSKGLRDNLGNYIYSDGTMKLGALSIGLSTATFNGDIYATRLYGKIVDSSNIKNGQIGNQHMSGISAAVLTTGTLNTDNLIFKGKITGEDGFEISLGKTGISYMKSNSFLSFGTGSMWQASPGLYLKPNVQNAKGNYVLVGGTGYSVPNNIHLNGITEFKDAIKVTKGGNGVTRDMIIKNEAGYPQTLHFVNGVLCDGILGWDVVTPSGTPGGWAILSETMYDAYDWTYTANNKDIAWVTAMCFSQDKTKLYMLGDFYNIGTLKDANGVCWYDLTDKTWHKMGTGYDINDYYIDEICGNIVLASNGDIYYSGYWSMMGGVSGTTGFAKWDGNQWSGMNGGVWWWNFDNSAYIYCMTIDSQDNIYLGGDIGLAGTSGGGLSVPSMVMWSIADQQYYDIASTLVLPTKYLQPQWTVMAVDSTGENVYIGGVRAIDYGASQTLYVGNGIVRWNIIDQTWYAVGAIFASGYFLSMAVMPNGHILVDDAGSGMYLNVWSGAIYYLAEFNGSIWVDAERNLTVTPAIPRQYPDAIHVSSNGIVYLGVRGSVLTSSGLYYLTANDDWQKVQPVSFDGNIQCIITKDVDGKDDIFASGYYDKINDTFMWGISRHEPEPPLPPP